ncbi:beta-galactosidase [Actinomycetospora endophytica]|uniref:Beta-galactosidase n=1 Tax=Actinomycetospora endophytica TaxID=2291215 RepID=A0ABS8PEP6_9PSEU|nr:beta-galactosidase [Actinomycetospora endophytica]MCD2196713.1 beta-galactosidase [Actinomycetospora endophytica]
MRARWWLAGGGVAAVVVVVVLVLTAFGSIGRPAPPERPAFGVLASSCDPDRVAALRKAGVTTAMTEMQWAQAEPAPGVTDEGYLASVRARIEACAAGGLRVVLGLGLQNPPPWVLGLPGAAFVDQAGRSSSQGEADLVFSAGARDAATAYLRDVAGQVGFGRVATVRVAGELGYPSAEPETGGTAFWAFGAPAQGGPGRAAGVDASPLPGWVPGSPTWQDAPVTADDAGRWYDWYTGSLADSVVWLTDALRGVGFTGDFQVPLAGRGVLPADRQEAVAGLLDGRADPDGALGKGLDYPSQFRVFADLDARLRATSPSSRILVDFTSLDDDSAVRARAADPPQDTCRPDDTTASLTAAGLDRGASQRWTVALAHEAGLGVVAENPGPPDLTNTGGTAQSDDEPDQMVQAGRYARDCGLEAWYLAFEDQLFEPGSGIDVAGYGRVIAGSAS